MFARILAKSGVSDKQTFQTWKKENEMIMENCFWYKRGQGMPKIGSLVSVFFHPEEPLVGLNYTPAAHYTLYKFKNGWTLPLRQCRGIIFDFEGNLIAKPFPKFFNFNEREETKNLPNENFDATIKHDGHLGIIFEYKGKFFITTRGSFVSKTSQIAAGMLKKYEKENNWRKEYPKDITTLTEIIHPKTRVLVDYKNKQKFILTGAYSRKSLEDKDYKELTLLSKITGIKITKRWSGNNLDDLKNLMHDPSIKNAEGYVVRFKSGLRVKFKFANYIGKMIEGKLSYSYLINKILTGNLEKTIEILPEEIYPTAKKMVENLYKAAKLPSDGEKKKYLYNLLPEEESTQYFHSLCRRFILKLNSKNAI